MSGTSTAAAAPLAVPTHWTVSVKRNTEKDPWQAVGTYTTLGDAVAVRLPLLTFYHAVMIADNLGAIW